MIIPAGNILLSDKDLGYLLSKLTDVASEWLNFGIYLGIPYGQLRIIKANNQDVMDCLRETLVFWLKKDNKSPTAGKLLKALDKMEEKKLAYTLEKSLSIGEHRKGIIILTSLNTKIIAREIVACILSQSVSITISLPITIVKVSLTT